MRCRGVTRKGEGHRKFGCKWYSKHACKYVAQWNATSTKQVADKQWWQNNCITSDFEANSHAYALKQWPTSCFIPSPAQFEAHQHWGQIGSDERIPPPFLVHMVHMECKGTTRDHDPNPFWLTDILWGIMAPLWDIMHIGFRACLACTWSTQHLVPLNSDEA